MPGDSSAWKGQGGTRTLGSRPADLLHDEAQGGEEPLLATHRSLPYGRHDRRPHLSRLTLPAPAPLSTRQLGPGLRQGVRRLGGSGRICFQAEPGRDWSTELLLPGWLPAGGRLSSQGPLSGPCKGAPNSQGQQLLPEP